jgi:RimJ/RimL family protein N-acetyltransferase
LSAARTTDRAVTRARLEFDEFATRVLDRLGRPPLPSGDVVGPLDELGLDSLDRLELMVAVEDLCGGELPGELLGQLDSLREAHEWYAIRVDQSAPRPPRAAPEPNAPGSVPMSTRRVRLRTLEPPDYEWLHRLTTAEHLLVRWRDRGQTFRIEEWLDRLWAGVAAQFVVTDAADRPLGLVTIYHHDAHNRHARLAVVFEPGSAATGWRLEGVLLAVNYAFEVFDLVKLYADVVDFNLPAFASGLDRWFVREGLLVDHEYAHGRHWPVHVLATSRDRFAVRWQAWWTTLTGTP